MKKSLFVCAVVVAAMFWSDAVAWHNQGHLMTAEVAWKTMSKGARCRAVQLLQKAAIYSEPMTGAGAPPADEAMFVSAATWPDRIKFDSHYQDDGEAPIGKPAGDNVGSSDLLMHKYWHYVDYPVPANPSKPPPSINARERIDLFRETLASTTASDDLKAYDLAWLIHLVGDVHQPLHAATQYAPAFVKLPKHPEPKDDGGNGVRLTWPDKTKAPNPSKIPANLHAYWDAAPGDDTDPIVAVLAGGALAAPDATAAAILDTQAWVTESHTLASNKVYAAPVLRGATGPFALDDKYLKDGKDITSRQIALGGVRLGKLLNETLSWPSPGCDSVH